MSLKSEKKDKKEGELSPEAELILAEAIMQAGSKKRPFYCI